MPMHYRKVMASDNDTRTVDAEYVMGNASTVREVERMVGEHAAARLLILKSRLQERALSMTLPRGNN